MVLRKLKELKVDVPPLLAGWHMLSRAGVPWWTHPQIKALCGGELNVKNVAKAMTRMFGGDSKPNMKDSALKGNDINLAEHYEDYYDDDTEEAYYNYYEEDETYVDDFDEVDYVGGEDDEPPQEIEEAAIATEEAYISYLDSRKNWHVASTPSWPWTWATKARRAKREVVEKEKVKEKGVSQVEPQKEKGNSLSLLEPNVLLVVDEGKGGTLHQRLQHRHGRRRAGVQPHMDRGSCTDFLPQGSRKCPMKRT